MTLEGLIHLAIVYVVWGSTYLAIRFAVREGAGFPPFWMSSTRVLVAGAVLLGWAVLRGQRILPSRTEILKLVGMATLLWLGGNGLVVYAEQRAGSGYAALLVSTTPLWVALVNGLLDRHRPTTLLVISLFVGLSGVGVLSAPALLSGAPADALSVLLLVLASLTWAGGTLLQQRKPVALEPVASSAHQLLLGGVVLGLAALVAREPWPTPTTEAFIGWSYLVTVGSLLGYTSFVRALQLLPANVAMTYSYVNPVIAVILGALILSEPITPFTVAGMALVLLGVGGVFRARQRERRQQVAPATTQPVPVAEPS